MLAVVNLYSQLPLEPLEPCAVFEDNQACIKMASNPRGWKRTKHIDVRYHFVRDLVEANKVILSYINTVDQCADLLTKALGGGQFRKLRDMLLGQLKVDH